MFRDTRCQITKDNIIDFLYTHKQQIDRTENMIYSQCKGSVQIGISCIQTSDSAEGGLIVDVHGAYTASIKNLRLGLLRVMLKSQC